ncbi:MAG: FKBP-type peptidyl-prolyl cis-trans isomerase [Candidatus Gracilibacteria bacterium]
MKPLILPILLLSCTLSSCSMPGYQNKDKMTSEQPPAHIITMSDTVILDYRLTQSGKILELRDNFTLKMGSHEPFPGLENAVLGMIIGDKKSLPLSAEYLYGSERTEQIARRSQLVKGEESDSLAPFSPHKFKTGAMASWNGGEMRIEKIQGEYVTISYPRPHPLAGKSLTLEVEVKSIQ